MTEHHVSVRRSARYFTLGPLDATTEEIWLVLHGYGQLAVHFVRSLRALDDGTRHIVAPEALSRYYVDGTSGHVGASWMTRVDREREIDDYVEYLDVVVGEVVARTTSRTRLVVLGFSQGVATASRWACRGAQPPDGVVLWGGLLPLELDLDVARRRLTNLHLVVGTDDEFRNDVAIAAEHERLSSSHIDYTFIEYDGTHRIDAGTLMQVAGSLRMRLDAMTT